MNGYLADGSRVQVPPNHSSVYVMRIAQEYSFSHFNKLTYTPYNEIVTHYLQHHHLSYPINWKGPVEGDGSWYITFNGSRIIDLWIEQGATILERLNLLTSDK